MLLKAVSFLFIQAVFTCCVLIAGESSGNVDLPDVYVLVSDAENVQADGLDRREGYMRVPGRVTNFASLLYGMTALECGVVSDLDWRRKPVPARSLADSYREAGYQTVFLGDWGMGCQDSFNPMDRGFDLAWVEGDGDMLDCFSPHKSCDSAGDLIRQVSDDKPCFSIVRQGLMKDESKKILDLLIRKRSSRAGVLIDVGNSKIKISSLGGYGGKLPKSDFKSLPSVYSTLLGLIGKSPEESPYLFYHQGGWPLTDSPEKHRHRGSIVYGERIALKNGLDLFPVKPTPNGRGADFSKPLDLGEYIKEHKELLMAHSSWWQRASKAINQPRSFEVGEEGVTYLTALDWRSSRIVHPDGSAMASEPMVYLSKLVAILRGLHENEEYKKSFPAYSGSWSVNIKREGRYKITGRLLPKEGVQADDVDLGKLLGGRAHARLGRNEVQLRVMKGASSVSMFIDAEEGVTDLECWFTGQLVLERELGAFFVEIERVGDRKYQLKAKKP